MCSLEFGIKTGAGHTYQLWIGKGSPVEKIETREQIDRANELNRWLCGSVPVLVKKMTKKWCSFGPLGFDIETKEGNKYLHRLGRAIMLKKLKSVTVSTDTSRCQKVNVNILGVKGF